MCACLPTEILYKFYFLSFITKRECYLGCPVTEWPIANANAAVVHAHDVDQWGYFFQGQEIVRFADEKYSLYYLLLEEHIDAVVVVVDVVGKGSSKILPKDSKFHSK